MRGYSLTTRLTALFSLTSACVLLGLGVLIFTAMDRHFAVEDYALLRDNMRLVEKPSPTTPAARCPRAWRTPTSITADSWSIRAAPTVRCTTPRRISTLPQR
jgi:hypothetical protein